jgi:AbiV family abortive infection protein
MKINNDDLVRGAIYSLETALEFLRDANQLYLEGHYASACIFGTNAREHLGRTIELLELSLNSPAGDTNVGEFKKQFERDHESKLRKSGIVWSGRVPDSLSLPADTAEFENKAQDIAKGLRKLINREPAKIHGLRCQAQYADIDEEKNWNRPHQIKPEYVHDMLFDVGNCYRGIFIFILPKYRAAVDCANQLGLFDKLNDFTGTFPRPEGDLSD